MAEGASGREGGGMILTSQGTTGMASPPWYIEKSFVRGVASYELWRDGTPGAVGRFSSFDSAKREAERMQLGLGSITAGGE